MKVDFSTLWLLIWLHDDVWEVDQRTWSDWWIPEAHCTKGNIKQSPTNGWQVNSWSLEGGRQAWGKEWNWINLPLSWISPWIWSWICVVQMKKANRIHEQFSGSCWLLLHFSAVGSWGLACVWPAVNSWITSGHWFVCALHKVTGNQTGFLLFVWPNLTDCFCLQPNNRLLIWVQLWLMWRYACISLCLR